MLLLILTYTKQSRKEETALFGKMEIELLFQGHYDHKTYKDLLFSLFSVAEPHATMRLEPRYTKSINHSELGLVVDSFSRGEARVYLERLISLSRESGSDKLIDIRAGQYFCSGLRVYIGFPEDVADSTRKFVRDLNANF